MVLFGSVAVLQARAVGLGNANGSTGMLRCVQWCGGCWVIFDFIAVLSIDFEACSIIHVPFRRVASCLVRAPVSRA